MEKDYQQGTEVQPGGAPAAPLEPLPLPQASADPFSQPLVVEQAPGGEPLADDDDEEDLEEGGESAAGAPGAPVASARPGGAPGAAKASSKGAPGRGGAGGPKMRRGIVNRLGNLTGSKTDPAAFAEALKKEAQKACKAAGVPFAAEAEGEPAGPATEEEPQPESPASSEENSAAPGEAPGAESASSGHKFTEAAPEEDHIMGVPAHQVLAVAPMTLAFWGSLARKLEGTRWDFSGERVLTMFENTPYKREIRAHPERQLAELSAVVVAKHASRVTDKADSPEALLFGAAFFAFGPQALENVTKAWDWFKNRLRRRREE